MNQPRLQVCPDQAYKLVVEWLIPLTDNGTVEEIHQAFCRELARYAAAAAQRSLRQGLEPDKDVILAQLLPNLREWLDRLEGLAMNPDMLAAAHSSWDDLLRTTTDMRDWINFLERLPASEATVPPATAVILARGDVP